MVTALFVLVTLFSLARRKTRRGSASGAAAAKAAV
jgi:hypothetical protein